MLGVMRSMKRMVGEVLANALVKWGDEGELGLWGMKGCVDGMCVLKWMVGSVD